MGEDEKKLHVLTQINTKINRDCSTKAEFYVNRGKINNKYYNFIKI
jgi:hypothetical protein